MYRFSVLPYANASPLVHFIPQVCPDTELVWGFPCETASQLINGNVDAAIVPVVDYFNTPGLKAIDGLGICADGNVESVLLQCNKRLEDIRSIKLDRASRTSNLLIKVLAKKFLPFVNDIEMGNDIEYPDANVIIGDRALCATASFESYDLAGNWKQMTGLPFVFAVWAYRKGHPDSKKITQILYNAKQAGCDNIEALSMLHAQRIGISSQRCYHYLKNCIRYEISGAERKGMALFRKLLLELKTESNISIRVIDKHIAKEAIDVK